jgi:hypothetical protein
MASILNTISCIYAIFKLLRRKLLDARGRVTGDLRLVEVYNHRL